MTDGPQPAAPKVGVVIGSDPDLEVMRPAVDALEEFDVGCEVRLLSAHRTPDQALEYARTAADRGLSVLIAGAGGTAHLPAVLAAVTPLPVIGVPVAATPLSGLDALLAIAQMPSGVPVACVAVDGGRNAGLLAARILGVADTGVRDRYERFREELAEKVTERDERVREQFEHRRAGGSGVGFR